MSDSQESMEVTLHTEIESGASGFSVAGGGNEGIFVKKVLKESSASKLFSLREGDQLLSATIFFDNIKYEDALKILQYSEPYKVQFSLKRKLSGKEDLETMPSATLSKKEKLSQGKETLEVSEKTTTEEDKANLIVKQRVGRQKRPKKDRLSWPKFQSIKGKKMLGQRRSRSTSDAYEPAIPDVSPTSTDTEFPPEEMHAKVKKGSQRKLKFPSIGFKIYRSKQETEEKSKLEEKVFTEYQYGTTEDPSEIITVDDSTSWAQDNKTKEHYEAKKDTTTPEQELTSHTKKCPEVEITIKKPKEKKQKSRGTTKPESTIVTSQIPPSAIEIKDSPTKQPSFPKIRKKKHRGSMEKIQSKTTGDYEQREMQIDVKDGATGLTYQVKQEVKITPPPHEANITTGLVSDLRAPDLQIDVPSTEMTLHGSEAKLEGGDIKIKMHKFQMPKFGISLPKGKAAVEGEITIPSIETEVPKTELKGEVTVRSVEMGMKTSGPHIEGPSMEVEVGGKDKMKMPDVKMPKIKGPQVGVTLPKVERDRSLPKVEVEVPEGEVSVKMPEAEGSIEGGGMKMYMPKFKMPSMGFSKPEVKGPKVDVDLSAPKPDVTLPSTDLSISKPELKTGELAADISISGPEVKFPTGQASLELKAVDFQLEAPSVDIGVEGTEGKLEGMDRKFKMPKFQMPKFGISLPKGKAAVDGDITVPSVDVQIPKAELKGEVTVPSVETGIKVTRPHIEDSSVEVEVGEMGKMKMPDVKMPSVKRPKIKGPQVGVTLSKVEGDVSLAKAEAELPEGEVSVKVPEAEGRIEGGGMKLHMPKFKMPSMGFSKPDVKGPKVDVDLSVPKPEVSLPSTDLSISKPELRTGELAADISVSGPEVNIPAGQASLEFRAPDFHLEAPSAEIPVKSGEAMLHGVDGKFKMPKFQMPTFGISLPKGTATVDGDITVPSIDVQIPKAELKGEVTVPSIETGIKVTRPHIEGPSVKVEVGETGKIKMPDVQMPSVKMPKIRGPQVGVTMPRVEGDVSLPKLEAELPEGEVSVKVPEAEGSIEGGGMKLHMPKFKMPSMGFSKPEVKGPKVDVDLSAPKVDVTPPSADLSISKPELKTGELVAGISVSGPEVKIPTGQASLELKAPGFQLDAPSVDIGVEGTEGKLEGVDGKFRMPKFQMPKFGISLPIGKAAVEGDITVPSVEAEVPKTELEGEVTVPSVKTSIKVSGPHIEGPSVEVEVGEKGKMKMPDVKMPSVKMPKIKGPQVGVTLSKVEGDISLPKLEAELPEGEVSVKVPEAEGRIEGGGMKMHMPKFKMPSMGFSKPEVKGPKVDVDLSVPKPEVSLPSTDLSISKPELKTGELAADISVSAPEVKIPAGQASLELKAPDFQLEAPSAEIPEQPLSTGISPYLIDVQIPKAELKGKVTVPSVETGIKVPRPHIEGPNIAVEVTEKGKMEMPDVKMPKIKAPRVGITLSKVEGELSLPKVEAELPEGEVSHKVPEAEGRIEGGGMKMHMPKFKMPSMGFSKPEVKGPKVDVDLSAPKVDVTPTDLSISAPE
ncbi:PREDICTED: protein AHNAK2, partial [Gekko japonicus]|uniref:Protein AHNAK2 n=1 Tax=Gekko japonicus TaxID=146911 RepID=A0ABM1JLW9_GEKJA